MAQGAYGERLRETFGVRAAPVFVTRTLDKAKIAVTEIRCDIENSGLSRQIPPEDAMLMMIQVRDVPEHDLFLDGRQLKTERLPVGTANIYDLRTMPVANSLSAFHHVSLYIPRAALNAIAEREQIAVVDEFVHQPGIGVQDEVLKQIAFALLPCFRNPAQANRLLVDHLTTAAAAHVATRYGNRESRKPGTIPSLGNRQLSVLLEMLASDLRSERTLEEMSEEIGFSALQVADAFRHATGQSVHEWLSSARYEKAVALMSNGAHSPDQIAVKAGYHDLAHMTSEFERRNGPNRNLSS